MVLLSHLYTYRFLSGIKSSPDGSRGAFLLHKMDKEKDCYLSDLWLLEGDQSRALTSSGDVKSFCWLSGGRLLVQSGKGRFCTVGLDGEYEPAFDLGRSVTGLAPIGGGRYALTVQHDLLESQRSDGCIVITEAPFYQNGGGYTSGLRNRLYIYDGGSGELTPVTSEETDAHIMDASGGRVLFTAMEYGSDAIVPQSRGLHLWEDGKTSVLVPQGEYVVSFACFGEKGQALFIGREEKNFHHTDNLALYAWEGGQVRTVFDGDVGLDNSTVCDVRYGACREKVYKDGRLYLSAVYHCGSLLSAIDIKSGRIETLSSRPGIVDDTAIIGGRPVFIAQRENRLQELYRLEENGGETCLTSFNKDALAGKKTAKMEEMTFENGGYTVHYRVLTPPDIKPGEKRPGLLYLHGGAKGVYTETFHHEMQALACAGYFVVYGDPRGSDGQGSRFAELRGHYGEADYSDMMKAMDTALEKYPIDKDRLGLLGGSYGGLMTNTIVGRTDRFKCAVAQRSISNMMTCFLIADNGISFVWDQMEATPWDDDGRRLWELSPVRYAKNVKTPLLLLHSDEDYTCHVAEAMQMYTALRVNGVPSRLVIFKGENHNLSRTGRPSQRQRRLEEILAWLEKYLGEGVHA